MLHVIQELRELNVMKGSGTVKPGFQLNATHATQPIALRALRALRKRKLQTTQAFDWLL